MLLGAGCSSFPNTVVTKASWPTPPDPPLFKGGKGMGLARVLSPSLALIFEPSIQCLVGLVECVFEVVVLGMKERLEGDLLSLGDLVAVEEAERTDRFEPHARVLVVDLLAQAVRADR